MSRWVGCVVARLDYTVRALRLSERELIEEWYSKQVRHQHTLHPSHGPISRCRFWLSSALVDADFAVSCVWYIDERGREGAPAAREGGGRGTQDRVQRRTRTSPPLIPWDTHRRTRLVVQAWRSGRRWLCINPEASCVPCAVCAIAVTGAEAPLCAHAQVEGALRGHAHPGRCPPTLTLLSLTHLHR